MMKMTKKMAKEDKERDDRASDHAGEDNMEPMI
jgi:hypothetical protein